MTKAIQVEVTVAATVEEVWDDVSRLETHSEWMMDASAIVFADDQQSGEGTRMEVETRIGPLRTNDVIEVTAWEPPRRIAVRHEGIVSGTGEFILIPVGERTRFVWREELRFPLSRGGAVTEFLARPVLIAVWRRNLRRFARRFNR